MVTLPASEVTRSPQVSTVDTGSAVFCTNLDARSDHVAVLDAPGMIVVMNAAWRRFLLG